MKYSLNTPPQKKNRKKIALIVAVGLILLASGGTYAYLQTRSNNPSDETAPQKTEADESVGTVPTYETESEGQKIDVPSNVNPDSIKNYELITENEQFKIRKLGNEYTITLYAIINSPSQSDAYRDQLKEYKQNALAYLQQQGINTSTIKITYDPEEAQSL